MLLNDEVFKAGDKQKVWQKYCGFFDLSLKEFMEIQKYLLLEQIGMVNRSRLGEIIMKGAKPGTVEEFRRLVPLTTFDNYAPYLNEKNESVLAEKPYLWGHTSGRGGIFKWVPYTERFVESFCINTTAAIIMACADRKGEVNVGTGNRLLQNLPPPPYSAGVLAPIMTERLGTRAIPPFEKYSNADFQTRIEAGFQIALRTGVDVLSSMTTVLVKMGEHFTESSGQMKFNRYMLHPQIMYRLITAVMRCKKEGRTLLPKDLWPLKGLICYGTDTAIYREQITHYWGKEPMELYAATETGVIAILAWNKKYMTFVPSSCFFEFIPEEEWLKSRENVDYQPRTVLLDEVEPGQRYEIITTGFYGMPFLRYRLGDLVRIVALEDEEAGIKLPQMVFESRADGLIDIAGFPRLDEKTIWKAIFNTGIKYEEWSVRKEYEKDEAVIRLYIELKEKKEAAELESLIHRELAALNRDYRDLEGMLGIKPLRVKLLPAGSFQRYYQRRKADGADLAHLKPPHMNASDTVILDLVKVE